MDRYFIIIIPNVNVKFYLFGNPNSIWLWVILPVKESDLDKYQLHYSHSDLLVTGSKMSFRNYWNLNCLFLPEGHCHGGYCQPFQLDLRVYRGQRGIVRRVGDWCVPTGGEMGKLWWMTWCIFHPIKNTILRVIASSNWIRFINPDFINKLWINNDFVLLTLKIRFKIHNQ